jgi:hypothetical protein
MNVLEWRCAECGALNEPTILVCRCGHYRWQSLGLSRDEAARLVIQVLPPHLQNLVELGD